MRKLFNRNRGSINRWCFLASGSSITVLMISLLCVTPSLGDEDQGLLVVAFMGDPQWGMTATTPQNVYAAINDINTLSLHWYDEDDWFFQAPLH